MDLSSVNSFLLGSVRLWLRLTVCSGVSCPVFGKVNPCVHEGVNNAPCHHAFREAVRILCLRMNPFEIVQLAGRYAVPNLVDFHQETLFHNLLVQVNMFIERMTVGRTLCPDSFTENFHPQVL